MCGAVDDRRIDDLPAPRGPCTHHPGQYADRQIERAAADIAHHGGRRHRRFARLARVPERTAQRDVIEIVTRRLRERTVLTPSGHASIDQARIAFEADIGAKTEALHYAGAHALDQRIAVLDEAQNRFDAARRLEIHRD